MTEQKIQWANALRGIAALLVVVYHVGQVFWTLPVSSAERMRHEPLAVDGTDAPAFARFLDWLPIEFGALGISLFFVLSGYVIAMSMERYNRPGFFIGRFLRVMPTFAFGYLFCVLVVLGVMALGDASGAWPGLGTVLGVVPGLPVLFDTDAVRLGVEWTLIIELAFYAVCLVAFRALTRRWYAAALVTVACVAVQLALTPSSVRGATPEALVGASYLAQLITLFLPLLLIGVVVSSVQRGLLALPALALVPAMLGAVVWTLHRSQTVPTTGEYQSSVVLAVGVFLAFAALAQDWQVGPVLRGLARISYSLYLTHAVISSAVLLLLVDRGVDPLLAVPLALLACLVVAGRLYVRIEAPTQTYGQQCARRASRRPVTPVSTAPPEPQRHEVAA